MRGLRCVPSPARVENRGVMNEKLDEGLLIEKWLEMKQHNQGRAEATLLRYRQQLAGLRSYLLERDGDLLSASAEDIEDFAGRYKHEQGVRPISRRVTVSAIRGFYHWAAKKNLVDDNPAGCLAMPKAASPMPRAMSLAHAEKLLMEPGIKTFHTLRDTAILAVLIGTGCRLSGVCNLGERDLIWTVSGAGTERLVLRLREKGKKERLVPVPMECSLLIRAYLGHPELEGIDRTLPDGDRALFVTTRKNTIPAHLYFGDARRIGRRAVWKMIVKYGQRAGIPRDVCHPHALRHLYGTELAEHDVDVIQRQSLLGHASPKTTEIYSHLAMRKLTATVDKSNPLGKMIGGPSHALANRLRKMPK